ncbi:MAG: YihY/virulence factor BrkB family protein [Microcystaceae cyanobacterium]
MIQFIQTKILPSKIVQLLIQTVMKWQQDNCAEMGAALAYYSLFSLFPTLLIILSVVGSILGAETQAVQQTLTIAQKGLPPEAYEIVKNTLVHLNSSSVGAGLIGFVILLFTASRIFGALDRSVDKIWKAENQASEKTHVAHIALGFILDKIFAFALVISTSFLLFLSLLSNIAIRIILEIVRKFEAAIGWLDVDNILLYKALQTGITFLLLTTVVMTLFKILPSTKVKWGDIWLGSMITVGLFMLLQRLVGSGIVSIGEQFKAYGVLGGVMVLMLWIYLTFQIFFLGCEFTYVYTYLFGSRRNEESEEAALIRKST